MIKASGLVNGIPLLQFIFFKTISSVLDVDPPRAVAYILNFDVYEMDSISGTETAIFEESSLNTISTPFISALSSIGTRVTSVTGQLGFEEVN